MRTLRFICILVTVCLLGTFFIRLAEDKKTLSTGLVRLHVVADSDEEADQSVKLKVRDAILAYTEPKLRDLQTVEQVKSFLTEELEVLTEVANTALREQGSSDVAKVTLCREAFPIRAYETFTLPSGVYESLRVTIGSGEGKNWWCVVFPSLCVEVCSRDVQACSAMSDSLSGAITGEPEYRVSFFLLDCLGRLENFFHFR